MVGALLFVLVTTAALVNDAKKFDVNCDANALMSIAETLISGPTITIIMYSSWFIFGHLD